MSHASGKKESPLNSLLLNIVIPSIVLMKFSTDEYLGPVQGLVVALLFPLAYGLWDFRDRQKVNFVSLLGLVSILLTGGIGLMKLDAQWIAVKEAAIPAVIGLVILGSLKTRFPLVRKMLYNEQIMNVEKVNAALEERGSHAAFERLLFSTSLLLAASFFLSSVLNYILARIILVSEPGSVAFNEELGRMTALSYPVIVLPSMVVLIVALWVLLRGIKKLTGLDLESVFKHGQDQKR